MEPQGKQRRPGRRKPFGWVAVVFSALVLTAGVVVGAVTGEWWALLCASGLVVVPLAGRRTVS
ncbi:MULTISPECIES: hypothetical protein [Cellulomonas]|jgi:hypothetical protein|uniref:hypothetical protein n=1 Tax=Cellulomonas TaxID=1707 RepID=UPI000626E3B4|nr:MULTISPECIES: hypothetical protein [Cellulomonas]